MAIITRWRMPAGELVRVGAVAPRRDRGCRPAASARAPARAPAPAVARAARAGPRRSGRPTRMTGFSAVIGSWKTIAICSPAHAGAGRPPRRERGPRRRTAISPPAIRARRGSRPTMRAQRHALAAARLADEAQRLAAADARTRRRRPRARRRARAGSRRAGRARGGSVVASFGPQQVGEAVAEQREPERGDDDRDARERRRAATSWSGTSGRRRSSAPVGVGGCMPSAEVAERDDREDVEHDVATSRRRSPA